MTEYSRPRHTLQWPGNSTALLVLFTNVIITKVYLSSTHPPLLSPLSGGIPFILFWTRHPQTSYTRDPARLWAGTMTGTAPMRSRVTWLTV